LIGELRRGGADEGVDVGNSRFRHAEKPNR
jgi:hypothetical protein